MESSTGNISPSQLLAAVKAEAVSLGQQLHNIAPKVNGQPDWNSLLNSVKAMSASVSETVPTRPEAPASPTIHPPATAPYRRNQLGWLDVQRTVLPEPDVREPQLALGTDPVDLVPKPIVLPDGSATPTPSDVIIREPNLEAFPDSANVPVIIGTGIEPSPHIQIPGMPASGNLTPTGRVPEVSQPPNRRALLKLATLAAAAGAVAGLGAKRLLTRSVPSIPDRNFPSSGSQDAPAVPRAPEALPSLSSTYGHFATPTPEVFIPGTTDQVKVPPEGKFNIVGYGQRHRFKIEDPKTKRLYEVPIAQFRVEQGSIIKKEDMPRAPLLGIRNDHRELMHIVPELGASCVRIVQNDSDVSSNEQLKQSIEVAKKEGLKILYTFNPSRLMNQLEIRKRLEGVFSSMGDYGNFEIELGNEPDNNDSGTPFWEGRDLAKFAEFIRISSEEIRKLRPDTKMTIGALVDLGKLPTLLAQLKVRGVDINRFSFAVHGYNTAADVVQRVEATKRLTKRPIMITEIGTSSDDPNRLSELLTAASDFKVPLYIHELPDWEGYGLADPISLRLNDRGYTLQADVSNSEGKAFS